MKHTNFLLVSLAVAGFALIMSSCATAPKPVITTISQKITRISDIDRPLCRISQLGGEVIVDYGRFSSSLTIPVLRKDDGSEFVSEMDAVNSMIEKGWVLRQAYTVASSQMSTSSAAYNGLFIWHGTSTTFRMSELTFYLLENPNYSANEMAVMMNDLGLNSDRDEFLKEIRYQFQRTSDANRNASFGLSDIWNAYAAVYDYMLAHPSAGNVRRFVYISDRMLRFMNDSHASYNVRLALRKCSTPEEYIDLFME